MTEALDIAALDARMPTPVVFTGVRGTGKTVLLHQARLLAAEEHSWLSVHAEVHADGTFTSALTSKLLDAARLYSHVRAELGGTLRLDELTLKASIAGFGADLKLKASPSPNPPISEISLREGLRQAVAAANDLDAGLVITIDELHEATRNELATLGAVLQEAALDEWSIVVVMAGLARVRSPKKMPTYFERCDWHDLGNLSPTDATEALIRTAANGGRTMSVAAAEELNAVVGGYPYGVQAAGHAAWRHTAGKKSIDIFDAQRAIPDLQDRLTQGVYLSRWSDASEEERTYLTAMASLLLQGQHTTSSAIAAAMGKSAPEVAYLRTRLLDKGTITATPRSSAHFIIPDMPRWIMNHADSDDIC